MKNQKGWTIGRGIGYGLKYVAFMGAFIAILAFTQFVMKFSIGYYENERFCDIKQPPIRACEGVDINNQDECCLLQYGEGYVWEDPRGCVFRGVEKPISL